MDRDQCARKRVRTGERSFQQPSLLSRTTGSSSSYSSHSQQQQSRAQPSWNNNYTNNTDNYNLSAAQHIGHFLLGIIQYLWGTLLGTLMILRPLLSFFLAILFILLCLGAVTKSLSGFRAEFHSRVLCSLPLVNHLMTCPHPRSSLMMNVPDFSDLVNKQAASYELIADSIMNMNPKAWTEQLKQQQKSRQHEQQQQQHNVDDPYGLILHSTKGNLPLPLLLKRAEIAVVDLKVLVKHSTLPQQPKNLLVDQLQSFHTRAKAVSRKLQFLQARANGCVDGLVIRNTYLTVELDRLEAQQRSWNEQQENGSALSRLWNHYFAADQGLVMALGAQRLQQLYQGTMEEARSHVRDLIFQAQDVLQNLDTIDQILSSIHEIVTLERRVQNKAQDETLAMLWTKLGGNRLQIAFHRENLQLLVDMESQRKATVGQIQTALFKLTEFEAEIGILRERIVDAAVGGTPAEGSEHMKVESPSAVEEKAKEARLSSAIALRSHIQQIDLVTTRLKERSFLSDIMVKEQADKIPGVPETGTEGFSP